MSLEKEPPISEAEPLMWKCGDTYQYPIPKPEGNPWDVVLEPYLKRDKIQCDAWKDEVQTLLIFAGLFSAVVTAFVIQSYQTLQPNPNDPAFLLLSRIADRLDNVTTSSSSFSSPFKPSASSIRINILWFISLILSLTTVLVGIVALQWIREHQRYTDALKPKEALAIYRMRSVALEKWYVPQVFTGLPLLLQGGLILFFAGTVDFLFSLDPTVAIPVTLVVLLTLLFLIATTVLPTLQCFLLALLRPSANSGRLPVQCPYKSPQSWAFHRFVTWMFSQGPGLLEFFVPPSFRPSPWNLRFLPFRFGVIGNPETWIKFDSGWLKIRDVYSQFIHGAFTPTADSIDPRRPTFDEAEILLSTVQEYSDDPDIVFAAYHCFHEVSQNALHREHSLHTQQSRVRHDILRRYYWNRLKASSNSPISSLLTNTNLDLEFLHDENMLYFLRLPAADFPQIPVHLLELQSRIMAYAFSSPKRIASLQSITLKYSNCHQWFEMMQMCEEYDMTQTGKFDLIRDGMNSSDSEETDSIPRSMVDTTVEQFFMIFSAFIQSAASIEDEHVKGTIYGHVVLRDFLQTPAYLYQYVSSQSGPTLSPDIQTVIESSLTYIASTLEKALTGNESQRTDFLFICTCLFLERLLTFYPFYSDQPKDDETIERKLHPLVIELTRYEMTVDGNRITELFGYLCSGTGLPYHEAQLNRKTYIPLYAFPQWLRSAVLEEIRRPILLLGHNQLDENHAQDPVLVLDSMKREKLDDMDDIHITVAEPDDYSVGALIDIDDDSDSQKLSGGRFGQTYLPHLPLATPVVDPTSRTGSGDNRTYNPHAEQVV